MRKRINRREFLRNCGGAAAGVLSAPYILRSIATAAQTSSIPDILVVKNGSPSAMVRKVIERFGGIGSLVKKGSKVVLKPNMTWALPPTQSGNTHPDVARTVAEIVMEAEPKEVVALDYPLRKGAFEISGVQAALETVKGVKVLKTEEERYYRRVEIPGAKVLTGPILVSTDVLDADTIINLPNAKSHGSTVVTFGMENWMGIVYDRQAFHNGGLTGPIAEISSLVKPALVIVDATRITLFGGPSNGNPAATRNLDMLIAGKDQVAVDAYTVGIAEWQNGKHKPEDIAHIRQAAEMGVGRLDLENLKVEVIDMKA